MNVDANTSVTAARKPLEWYPGVPVTGDNLEPVFMAALEAGDVEGVGHCLTLAAVVDPHRAAQWYDDLRFAVRLRELLPVSVFTAVEPQADRSSQ